MALLFSSIRERKENKENGEMFSFDIKKKNLYIVAHLQAFHKVGLLDFKEKTNNQETVL